MLLSLSPNLKLNTMKYVAYYRVSTEEQGKSGLGLKAQRTSVTAYIKSNGTLISEFQDIESGSSETRLGMEQAIQCCRENGATLVVKELSRITRGGFKYRQMLEQYDIDFIESSSPFDPVLVKDIKFAISREERIKIKTRVKDALAEITAKLERGEQHLSKSGNLITALGKPENLSDISRARSIEIRQAKASNNENNRKATAFILALHETHTLKQMSQKLNEAGFVTSRGCSFSQMQVKRLLDKAKK